MKAIFALIAASLLLSSTAALAGPLRNCRPEDRLPGKRCADEWAVRDEGGGREQDVNEKALGADTDKKQEDAANP